MANILVFGDSITYGSWDLEGGWVDRLKHSLLGKSLDSKFEEYFEVYNLGVPGDTTSDLLLRFNREAKSRFGNKDKTVVLFQVGVNDSTVLSSSSRKVSQKEFEKNLTTLIKEGKNYAYFIMFIGLTPVIDEQVSPIPWSPNESYIDSEIKSYDTIIRKVSNKTGVEYLDLFDEISREEYKNYLEDGVHPNSEGHRIIFETVKENLLRHLL